MPLKRIFRKRFKVAPCYHCGVSDYDIETRPSEDSFITVIRCKKCGSYSYATANTIEESRSAAILQHNYEYNDFKKLYEIH